MVSQCQPVIEFVNISFLGPKEIPAWMTSASIGSSISNIDKSSAAESKSTSQTSTAKSSQSGGDLFIQRQSRAGAAGNIAISQSSSVLDEDHIKKTLMHHENKTMSHVNLSAVSTNRQKANQNQVLKSLANTFSTIA